jgi:hypothetical protein
MDAEEIATHLVTLDIRDRLSGFGRVSKVILSQQRGQRRSDLIL